MQQQTVEENMILLALTGSRLYRIHNPESDYDYKGITVPTTEYILGLQNFEQLTSFKSPSQFPAIVDTDSTVYSVQKFCHLATLNNPNILELLWLEPEDYLYVTDTGRELIGIREAFLSQKVYWSYSGYAWSQFHRIQTHRKWLRAYHEDPSFFNVPPNPVEYGLGDNMLSKSDLNAFLEFLYLLLKDASQYHEVTVDLFSKVDFKGLLKQYPLPTNTLDAIQYYTRGTKDFVSLLHNTQTYKQAVAEYDAYHSWRKNRNSARALLEAKTGYDGKAAGHCLRLMRSGVEILQGKGVIPNREIAGDAGYLRAVRNGDIEYTELVAEFDCLKLELETAKNNTALPKQPAVKVIEATMMGILKRYV